jgi:hypothetical protein
MSDQSRTWRDMPPLFLAGVLMNWLGIGLLAWKPHQMVGSAVMLSIGTVMMFVAAYEHRPSERLRPKADRSPNGNANQQ